MRVGHHLMTWSGWLQAQKLPWSWPAVLGELRAAGYDACEAGGSAAEHGPAADLRRIADDAGVSIVAWSAGVTANAWPPNTDEYRRELDYAAELGVRTVAVCGGFLAEQRRTTVDGDYRQFADNLGAAMAYAARLGLDLAFHPHRGCIVETAAEVDRLKAFLPELRLCIDTGHLVSVGTDPVALIEAHGPSIAHVHLKDWDVRGRRFTEIGAGNAGLDFAQVLLALRRIAYVGAVVVERDAPPIAAVESARVSRAGVRDAFTAVGMA